MKILDVPQSGSVAGVTSSRNRYGQYRRSRATPVNPNSPAQQNARNALASASIAWRGLDDETRAAWDSYAAGHPTTDSLGQTITLTGLQAYCGINALWALVGAGSTDTPPTGDAPQVISLDLADTTHAAFDVDATSPDPVPANTYLIWEASPPLSAGRNFNKDFRVVNIDPPAATSPKLEASDLSGKFGTLRAGQKFFIRARLFSTTVGLGAYSSLSTVLT